MTSTFRTRLRAGALPLLIVALLAPLSGCEDDSSGAASDEPTAASVPDTTTSEPSAATSDAPLDFGAIEETMNGWQVRMDLEAEDRFRLDYSMASRIHLLPVNVVTDPKAERWGDILVWSPTKVYDPVTQERAALPADPVAWLRDNPGIEVLREKRVQLGDADGHRAWQFDAKRDGLELFGDREGGFHGDGFERIVLWQVEDTWFVAQAGTFLGRRGVLAPEAPDDVLGQVLSSGAYTRA